MSEFTEQAVYFVLEHDPRGDDRVVLLFEDDPRTLVDAIEYCIQLADGASRICTGEFHAASPGDEYLNDGDWYLQKCHGVGVSHDLETVEGDDSRYRPPASDSFAGP